MLKLIKPLLLSLCFVSASSFANNLHADMMAMSQHLVGAMKADSQETFQSNLQQFIDASEQAKNATPKKLQDNPAALPDYQAGMQKVIDVAKEAQNLASQGKLDEAKEALKQMPSLRREYHSQYK